MSQLTIAAVAGVALISVLRFLPYKASHSKAPGVYLGCILISLVGWAFVIHSAIRSAPDLAPSTGSVHILKTLTGRLLDLGEKTPENVVLIDGSSYAARAVDYKQMEARLQEAGFPSVVLGFAFPGACEIERAWKFDLFSHLIGARGRDLLSKRNVVFVRETAHIFDLNPLGQIRTNLYTDQTLAYLQPEFALDAVRTLASMASESRTRPDWSLAASIASHGLMNAFNVSSLYRWAPFSSLLPATL